MQNLCILGSTGSVGQRALDVVRNNKDKYNIVALSAHHNTELLLRQIREFSPQCVVVTDKSKGETFKNFLPAKTRLYTGGEYLREVAVQDAVDTVLVATAGIAALEAVVAALIGRKKIALASKEILVTAGSIIQHIADETGQRILPVDSEHSAVLQCLLAAPQVKVNKIILTASGGPFLHLPPEKLQNITAKEALNHPTWKMGRKITVDSATMFNKGLEIIEARWLFDIELRNIEILIHPQSIVHAMVEFADYNTLAVLSHPDMYQPISFALSYPERLQANLPTLNLIGKSLDFFLPPPDKFPFLSLCRKVLELGGLAPTVLNAANDATVTLFLDGKIKFTQIYNTVQKALEKFKTNDMVTIENIIRLTSEVCTYVETTAK
jgi:1-deoxy-D-xylulose-5-phosphate reductoisomerase